MSAPDHTHRHPSGHDAHHDHAGHEHGAGGHACCSSHADAQPAPQKVKDPVCGMWVDPHTAKHRAEHAGRPYYFCSAGCREKFLADPQRYLAPAEGRPAAPPVPEGTIYTCPMHPEVRQVGPGSCPICGMALEPVMATAETGPNPELVDMRRRFRIGLALTVPVVALEMGGHFLGLDHLVGRPLLNWAQLAARDARRPVGGLAVLRAGLALARHAQPQHVHADRHGHRRGMALQRRRDARAGTLPGRVSRHGRRRRRLFRGRRGHHRAGAARPGAGAARPRIDRRRDPRAARPRAQDRAPRPPGRQRGGGRARPGRGRRRLARAAGRARAGRRRRRRRAGGPSTNPWSPANRCPSPRSRARARSAAR